MFSSEGWSFTFSTYPIRIRKNNGTLLPSVARIRHVYPTGNFLCSHKFHKILNYGTFVLNRYRKQLTLYPKKLSLSSQKYGLGIWNPRPIVRTRIPGSKKHRIPDPQHYRYYYQKIVTKLSEIWVGDPGSG